MRTGAPIPVFRSFDAGKAKAFWIDYLGFELGWEHRFEPGTPLYMEVRLGECALHLSEHHGDATPGGRIRVEVEDVVALHASLRAKPYPNARPDLVDQPYGTREIQITDPFDNTVIFWSAL